MTPAASNHSITPASGSSATPAPRSSAARSGLLLADVDARDPCEYLERLATKIDDTHVDLAAHADLGSRQGRQPRRGRDRASARPSSTGCDGYIVCIRDITERHLAEVSVRESEGRYRTLVEHAPEVIVVFDVDCGQVRRRQRQRLPLLQDEPRDAADQRPRHDQSRAASRTARPPSACRAATSRAPWPARSRCSIGCTAIPTGQNFPCEVRFVRLPSSNRRLLRASIIDITERKRADAIASGERRVFEKIAANAPLSAALESICEVIERAMPESCCAINLLDRDKQALSFGVAPNLPREFVQAMDYAPIGIRYGSCAAAVYLSRLVTVADVETDALWEYRREAARQAGFRAAWSAPIVASDGQVVGTFAVYRRQAGIPLSRDHELMLRMAQIAGIAIERRAAEDALRNSESKFRGLFESVMEGVYQTTRDGRILVANPAFVKLLGYSSAEELYQVPAGALYWYPSDRENFARRAESRGRAAQRRIRHAPQGRLHAGGGR